MLLKPGEKTPMKNLFTLIFVFFILQSFAQEYGKEGYQEKRFDEAIQSLKEKEFEKAAFTFYFVYRYNKNELGEIALKKSHKFCLQVAAVILRTTSVCEKTSVFTKTNIAK